MDEPEHKITKLDRAIAVAFPGWAAKRVRNRREFAYEAAIASRLRGYAVRTNVPNDFTEARDRIELNRQARDLAENFGLFAAIMRKLAIYSFGRVRYRAQTGNKTLNRQIDNYIARRAKKCDISGRFSLAELARMALFETQVGGDCLAIYRNSPTGTAPQLIDSDRLGGGKTGFVSANQFAGVEFDADTGTPLQYWVYDRTPAGAYVDPIPYRPEHVAHVFDPERYDRQRGITPFAPVINEMRDLKEVMEACLIGVKFENYHSGFISGGLGQPNDPQSFFGPAQDRVSSGASATETKMSPGVMQYLPEGQTATLVKSERPTGQFQSYLELLIRTIANALALPYGFVYSLSGLGGPAARMDAAQAHRVIEYWQGIISERFLLPTVERWILDGMADGAIATVQGTDPLAGQFQFPPRITIDVGRESAAEREEIRAGLRTRADWWDEEGKDAEREMEIIREEAELVIANAKKLSETTGLPVERCLDMLDNRNPNGTPSFRDGTGAETVEEVKDGDRPGYDTQTALRRILSQPVIGELEPCAENKLAREFFQQRTKGKVRKNANPRKWFEKYASAEN